MRLKFKEDKNLEVFISFDDVVNRLGGGIPNVQFAAGSEHEVVLLADHGDCIDVRWSNGGCSYNVPKALFERLANWTENHETGEQGYYYTVINPEDESETKVAIHHSKSHITVLSIPNSTVICAQQLAELGALFLALAGQEKGGVDYSSCLGLLDGYGIEPSEVLTEMLEKLDKEG